MGWRVSGFGDEITEDLTTQLRVLRDLGVDALEPRRVRLPGRSGKNIVELDDAELQAMAGMLSDHGLACSQIGAPVGKAPLGSDLAVQRRQLDGAVRAARALGTPYIRVFAFQRDPEVPGPEALSRAAEQFRRLAEHAARRDPDIRLSLENEHDLYGATPAECLEIIQTAGAGNLVMCLDPGNFVRAGVRPYDQAWSSLGSLTAMIHVKDCRAEGAVWVPAGDGNGQIPEILQAADPSAIAYLSLEPHLVNSPWGAGREPEAVWAEAHAALSRLLDAR